MKALSGKKKQSYNVSKPGKSKGKMNKMISQSGKHL
jgi:hypothetical protein